MDVFRAEIILMQQISAALVPSSSEISKPTFPLYKILPSITGP